MRDYKDLRTIKKKRDSTRWEIKEKNVTKGFKMVK